MLCVIYMGILAQKFEESLEPYSLRKDLDDCRQRLESMELQLEQYREGMYQQNECVHLLIKLLNRRMP